MEYLTTYALQKETTIVQKNLKSSSIWKCVYDSH